VSKASDYLVALDDGHGISTAGNRTPILPNGLKSETGNFMHENEFNRAVVTNLDIILKRCGFRTLLVAPTDEDVPLKTRTDLANAKKADAYVSIHANAIDGRFDGNDPEGLEVFHYPNSTNGKKLATLVHKHLIQGTKQKDRGVKSANFHVLRETNMVAILVEAGFMDNLYEAKLLLSKAFREEVATEVAKGICEYFKVPFVEGKEVPKNLYRVRLSWEDAKSQKGAFSVLQNAIDLADANKGYKVFDESGKQVYPEVVEPPKKEKLEEPKVAIMGASIATSQQMAQYLLSHNSDPKIKITALEFAELFLEEGAREGVRGDIAFCQSMHETGWLKYGGQVLPEQNNYSGIGATNNSPVGKGAWFKDEREGVRAQIQHLKAYASKEALTTECVDPRFNLVTRGIAPNWTDLNGRWAVPGTTYGQSILALYNELVKVKVTVPEPPKEDEKVKVLEEQIKELTAERNELKNQLAQANKKLADIKNILN
jgi:N-acetylmuramoyl-L-alanine amidase